MKQSPVLPLVLAVCLLGTVLLAQSAWIVGQTGQLTLKRQASADRQGSIRFLRAQGTPYPHEEQMTLDPNDGGELYVEMRDDKEPGREPRTPCRDACRALADRGCAIGRLAGCPEQLGADDALDQFIMHTHWMLCDCIAYGAPGCPAFKDCETRADSAVVTFSAPDGGWGWR